VGGYIRRSRNLHHTVADYFLGFAKVYLREYRRGFRKRMKPNDTKYNSKGCRNHENQSIKRGGHSEYAVGEQADGLRGRYLEVW
jgi:hypothetical protein